MKRMLLLAAAALVLLGQQSTLRAQATYRGSVVKPFTCVVVNATATKECKAATAGQFAFVTDALLTANAAPQSLKVTTGTGTDCASGQADLTAPVQFPAVVGNVKLPLWHTPLQPSVAGLAVCVTPSAATSFSATLSGFVVP